MNKNLATMPRAFRGFRLLAVAGWALALMTVFSVHAAAQTGTWTLDPNHTAAHFTVRHLLVTNVRGGFGKTTGTVQYDPNDPTKLAIEATIDTTTLNSGVAARDKDLTTNYLEIEKYPTMTFQSKRAEGGPNGTIRVTGDLTLHGVTKEVTLDVSDIRGPVKNNGVTHIGAMASTKISRKDYGISKDQLLEGGGSVVGDEVDITIDIDMTQGTPAGRGRGAAPPAPAPVS